MDLKETSDHIYMYHGGFKRRMQYVAIYSLRRLCKSWQAAMNSARRSKKANQKLT